jgi:GH15 family glucan-1,4-alpha-glucosidase
MRRWPIEDHGLVGDLHTTALVALDGTVDVLSFPPFASPSVFAALLDAETGGHFAFGPLGEVRGGRQFYLPDTNVLMTRASAAGGVTELLDLMPVEAAGLAHDLVRHLKVVRGRTRVALTRRRAFDYARSGHRARHEDGAAVASAELAGGDEAWAVLEPASAGEHGACSGAGYSDTPFDATVTHWRRRIGRSTYRGRRKEIVDRSALALELSTSVRHGSLVAAPHLRPAGGAGRGPQPGLPLHLDPRCRLHPLRLQPAQAERRG